MNSNNTSNNNQFKRKTANKSFSNHKGLDDFIQLALDKYQFVDPAQEMYEATGAYSKYIVSNKSAIPDLVIWNKKFDKNECFIDSTSKEFNLFPRVKFILKAKPLNNASNDNYEKKKDSLKNVNEKNETNENETNEIKEEKEEIKENFQQNKNSKEKTDSNTIKNFNKNTYYDPYNEEENIEWEDVNVKDFENTKLKFKSLADGNKEEYESDTQKNNKSDEEDAEGDKILKKLMEKNILTTKNDSTESKRTEKDLKRDSKKEIKEQINTKPFTNNQQNNINQIPLQDNPNIFNPMQAMNMNFNPNIFPMNDLSQLNKPKFNQMHPNQLIQKDLLSPNMMTGIPTYPMNYYPLSFLEDPTAIINKNIYQRGWLLIKENKTIGNFNSVDLLYYLEQRIIEGNKFERGDLWITDYDTDMYFKPLNLYDLLKENLPVLLDVKRPKMQVNNMPRNAPFVDNGFDMLQQRQMLMFNNLRNMNINQPQPSQYNVNLNLQFVQNDYNVNNITFGTNQQMSNKSLKQVGNNKNKTNQNVKEDSFFNSNLFEFSKKK